MSGILAGIAMWLLLPSWSRVRVGALYEQKPPRSIDAKLLVTLLTPLAAIVLFGPWIGILASLALTPMVRGFVGGLETAGQRRRHALLVRQLPSALDLVVSALDAGRPPVAALQMVGDVVDEPLGGELRLVSARLAAGAEPHEVWRLLSSHPVLGSVGRAFSRAEASGMPVSRVVAAVAAESRRTRRGVARERSRRVGVRTTAPLGACFLPAFFLVGVVPTIIGIFSGLELF